MNFELSPEQEQMQATVRDYLLREQVPMRVRERADDKPRRLDTQLWAGLMDLGLGAVVIPEEFGGLGLGVLDLAVAAEAIGYGLGPGAVLGHAIASIAIDRAGSDEQRKTWLPGLADGTIRAALVWDEPGSPVIDGAGADVFVVRRGESMALLRASSAADVLPLSGIDRSRMIGTLDLTGATGEELPGGVGVLPFVRSVAQVLVSADAFGGAVRLLELTVDYARTRKQWGQLIGGFQAVKHQLAELALLVEPSRGLYWYAAHALDVGLPDARSSAALAKAHITERSVEAGRASVELHGGFGYTWECDVHLYLRRALLNRQFLGTPEALRQELATWNGW